MLDTFLVVLSRWVHVASAVVLVGGAFFLRVVLPVALKTLDEPTRQAVLLRCRAVFKYVVHTGILLLLLSGMYNTLRNWDAYKLRPAVMHGLWGMHLLVAIVVFSITIYLLAGPTLKRGHKALMAVNVTLMAVILALGASLKYARDTESARQRATPSPGVRLDAPTVAQPGR